MNGFVITPPKGAIQELTDRRSETSKTFDMGNGQRHVKTVMGRIHYKDPVTKRYEEVDTTFQQHGKDYIVESAPYDLSVRPDKLTVTYRSKAGGEVIAVLEALDGKPLSEWPINIAPRMEADRLWLDAVLPDLDICVRAHNEGVRIQHIMHSGTAPRSFDWEINEDEESNARVAGEPKGFDNLLNADVPGRVTRPDKRRKLERQASRIAHSARTGKRRFVQREEWLGRVARVDPITRVKSWTDEIVYPVLMNVDINETIPTTADDGQEQNDTTWYDCAYTSELKFGRAANRFDAGFRFTTVALPQGANVSSATLTVHVSEITDGQPSGEVWADDVDDAPAWGADSRPSQIIKTTASTQATITQTGDKEIDVTGIVQEIASRAGWSSNNDMRFGFLENLTGTGYDLVSIVDWTTWGNQSFATLDITYSEGAVGPEFVAYHRRPNPLLRM